MAAALCLLAPAHASANPGWDTLRTVIDGPEGEAWITFHPSGQLVLFDRNEKDWKNHHIFMTRYVGGGWTEPVKVPFTSGFQGTSPRFSADGKSVLFASWRPLPGAAPPKDGTRDLNIWRSSWDGERFGRRFQ